MMESIIIVNRILSYAVKDYYEYIQDNDIPDYYKVDLLKEGYKDESVYLFAKHFVEKWQELRIPSNIHDKNYVLEFYNEFASDQLFTHTRIKIEFDRYLNEISSCSDVDLFNQDNSVLSSMYLLLSHYTVYFSKCFDKN